MSAYRECYDSMISVLSHARHLLFALVNQLLLVLTRFLVCIVRRSGDSVLVVRSVGIGDFVLFSECLPALSKCVAPSNLDICVPRGYGNLAETCPGVRRIIEWDVQKFRLNPFYRIALVWRLARQGYGTVINAQVTHEHHGDWLVCAICCPETVGFEVPEHSPLNVRMKRPYYTRLIKLASGVRHELARNEDLLKALGAEVPCDGLRPRVFLTDEDRRMAKDLLAPISDSRFIFCLMPGCLNPIRQWPTERYVAVACELTDRCPGKISFAVLGSKKDQRVADAIARDLEPNVCNLAGRTNLRVLAAVIEACDLYIGVETGAAHMAMAVDTPAVVILGGGHFGRFMPYAGRLRTAYKRLDCYYCDWACVREQPDCILGVTVEDVIRSALGLIEEHELLTTDTAGSQIVEALSGHEDQEAHSLDGS